LSVVAAPADCVAELYRDHHGWLHAWLRRKLGCSHRAADLAHDTFVRLLAKEEPLPIREPRAFLTTMAQGMVANLHRRHKLEQAWLEALAALPEPLAPSPEAQAIMLETLVEIDRRLNTLPALVRRAFLLSQLDGLPQAEIAAKLGVSVPTVKRYVAKALVLCCFADEAAA
jgi:RNA polymerase sigma factor (sigma-70 family)